MIESGTRFLDFSSISFMAKTMHLDRLDTYSSIWSTAIGIQIQLHMHGDDSVDPKVRSGGQVARSKLNALESLMWVLLE